VSAYNSLPRDFVLLAEAPEFFKRRLTSGGPNIFDKSFSAFRATPLGHSILLERLFAIRACKRF
jgi:hypothetical protein